VSGTVALLAVGLLLIGLLAVLLRRTEPTTDDCFSPPEGCSFPPSLKFEDRRKDILDRIFGLEDWEFVLNHGSKETRRLFLIERKKTALYWLSEIRSLSRAAMRFHIHRARKLEKLQPTQELKLAANFFAIRAKCEFIAVMLALRGPVALRSMVGRAFRLSDQFKGWLEVALRADGFPERTEVSD
jgi:hypothetical protein